MPTYQYACTACQERLEVVQSFSDPALTECPVCAGPLRKVFSAVGVVFKGSGFYKTDSRASSSAQAEAKTDAAPADSTPAGGNGKAESSSSASSGGGGGGKESSSNGSNATSGGSSATKPAAPTPAGKSA